MADQLFGVEVDTVQEVLSYNEYTPVPLAPPAVGGLFNLRGQVIAAVDLRVQLGLARQAMEGPVMNVILRGDGEPVSLLVDRIGEVVDLDDEAFEGPPDTLSERLWNQPRLPDAGLLGVLMRSFSISFRW